jgi:ribose 5-phosphate isomerase B
LVPFLRGQGYEVTDCGAHEYNEGDDYPDFVVPVAREVSMHPNEVKGIVIGGSGEGEAMCANRFRSVRAVAWYGPANKIASDTKTIIEFSREHNDANILSIGARFVTEEEALKAVKLWLDTPFSGDERHKRRLEKIERVHG